MNKHCMSVASLRVGTPLGFDQRRRTWVGARGVGGAGTVGARLARGGGGGGRVGRTRGGKVQANFRLFFVCLMQAIP